MERLAKAHVQGPQDEPLLTVTIPQMLRDTVARHGGRDALVVRHQNVRWSYYDLARAVDDLAAGLLALGLEPGDRIGIWSPNRYEWVVTQFATARVGLVLVNINPAYRLAEVDYALNKVAAKALIIAPSFKTSDYLGMMQTLAPELAEAEPGRLQAGRLPHLRMVIRMGPEKTPGMLNYDAVTRLAGPAQRARLDKITADLDPDDAINIQFTSGTTGAPKGATLTHRNVVNNGWFIGERMRFTERDRLCIPVPLYHCFGMVLANLACVTHGACMVFPGEGFDAREVLETVAAERCTALHGVPTMFIAELDHPDFRKYDLTSLRTGIMAGAPCPIEVMKRVVTDMGMREVTIAYGMTETSPVSFQSTTDDPLERRVATVGRIHPHVEVKIVDDRGRTVRPGERGELLTRGYSVMRGYWDEPEKTRDAIDEGGWMHTGDLATIDEEGYCNIVGRVKDMVIRGGENLYPREIEEYLFRHPKVQAVQVFGVPDDKYGEELCAWVMVKPGERLDPDELKDFCRGQIAHQKIPRYIRVVDEFPMTVTGKPQKFLMRAEMVKALDLKERATA
ncbi:MAG: AMP-binding protein [Alphaproteobacteria bacterium]|jgi:fatty-acyl-CoA synthase|nr:AMP-binding protein [Alphaproteobacteria bacterium]